MKYIFAILTLCVLLCNGSRTFAAPGDTLIVPAFQDVTIVTNPSTGGNAYSQWAVFPGVSTSYQKVLMYMTFQCPDNMDCGEWDYLDPVRIGRPQGVNSTPLNWEFSRFITPYGGYWGKGSAWKHGWYYDVTDFAPKWHDSVEIVYYHSGYETNAKGWKINIQFLCIEGTPNREVTNITPAWTGNFPYTDSIEYKYLTPKTFTLGASTKEARLKIIQTGHGMNTDNCSEFCPKTRDLYFDGALSNSRVMWRECGFNSLYPQAGTWLYDRGNWCPGASVFDENFEYRNLSPSTTHTWNVDMEAVPAGNYGVQVLSSYLVEYKQPAFSVNPSLEGILAPSKEYGVNRINPVCGRPVILVKNNGTTALTALKIEYGARGGVKSTYNWTGNLSFLQTDTVRLPTPSSWAGTSNVFEVELKDPNGGNDQNLYDNKGASAYDVPPVFPNNQFIVEFKSNNAASENYYYIREVSSGNIVFQKSNFNNNILYRDTFNLVSGNCYSFEFYDDGPISAGSGGMNNDGLSWWANSAQGTGSLRLYKPGNPIPFKQFNPDFGTKIFCQFSVNFPMAVPNTTAQADYLNVFPNPSSGVFTLEYLLGNTSLAEVFDIRGTRIASYMLDKKNGQQQIDLSGYPKGFYLLKVKTGNAAVNVFKLLLQ